MIILKSALEQEQHDAMNLIGGSSQGFYVMWDLSKKNIIGNMSRARGAEEQIPFQWRVV